MNLINILKTKCPNCHKDCLFKSKRIFALKIGKMNSSCSQCGHDFEREPGFYTGAMYVSYGLSLIEIAIVYIVCRIAGMETYDYSILIIMVLVLLVLLTFNFKVSRAVWLYIFSA